MSRKRYPVNETKILFDEHAATIGNALVVPVPATLPLLISKNALAVHVVP